MANIFKILQNTTVTPYIVELIDGNGNRPNLTGATVKFQLVAAGASVFKINAAAVIVGAPVLGTVQYNWQIGDTNTLGLFYARWEVTYLDGSVDLFPNDQLDRIEVVTGPNPGYDLSGAFAPWTTIADVRACCHSISALSGSSNYVSDDSIRANINVASDLLYTLTAQQFPGEGTATLRPCRQGCFGWPIGTMWPFSPDPSSYPPRTCGCSTVAQIDLGYWPVTNIVYVLIDGSVVNPSTYRLDNNRWLIRMENNDGWPSCQALDRASSLPGTMEVMIEYGIAPPPSGVHAATRLACELSKACAGVACDLPGRVTSVNRQQLSFTMINPSMLANGLTGIYDVDLFIMAFNPHRVRGSTVIWSPDLDVGSYRAGV